MKGKTMILPVGCGGRKAVMAAWLLASLAIAACWAAPAGAGSISIAADGRIRDQAGRCIRVERPFGRIIALYGAHAENLFALGYGARLIGVSAHADHPAAAAKAVFSHRDDPEKFLAAHPDLVLSRPMIERAYPNLIRRLEQSGITVVSLQPATVAEMYTYWEALGVLVGDRPAALNRIAAFRAEVAAIDKLARTVVHRRHVFFEAIHDKMKTFSPGAMPLFALETAGGINVAGDAIPSRGTNIANYGKERILAQGERIEVYLAQVGPMNPVTLAQIRQEPGFSAIRAVREGRVHLVDEMLVSRPTPRLVEGMIAIGRVLYPEVFTAEATEKLGLAMPH